MCNHDCGVQARDSAAVSGMAKSYLFHGWQGAIAVARDSAQAGFSLINKSMFRQYDIRGHPDPVKVENCQDLIKGVQAEKADLGIGFDGDGDRLGVVAPNGEIIWGDILMILYWREILTRHPGLDCIVDVKCSQALIDEIERLGGKPIIYKTGHSLIKSKMKEMGEIFTGEMSGHMFFAYEYYGYDDAIYAAARLLRIQ